MVLKFSFYLYGIFYVFLFTILYCYYGFQMCNLHCLSMHGDKSQRERSRILESFLAGECPVLVCTALLGRGIDLPNVSQVSFQTIKFAHIIVITCLWSLFLIPLSLTLLKTRSFLIWFWHVSCYGSLDTLWPV